MKRFFAAGVCVLALGLAGAAAEEATYQPTVIAIAPSGPGVMRTRVQHVFDPAAREVITRRYTVHDTEPALKRDFIWQADDALADRDGPITGTGRLTWRAPGTAHYNPAALGDVYTGAMRNGRAHGNGVLHAAAGWRYEGAFRNGQPHGRGRLALPNGEFYEGEFRAGVAAGPGTFTDVSGEIFEGRFEHGRRHGEGRTTLPGGLTYQSRWASGVEAPNSIAIRVAQAGAQPPNVASTDTVRLGVTARAKPKHQEASPAELLGYVARPDGDRIRIVPDDAQLVSVWKGGGIIEPEVRALKSNPGSGNRSGLFNYDADLIFPPTMVFEVQNRSPQKVEITDFYLDVRQSETENQPALQIDDFYDPGNCSGGVLQPDENQKGAFLPKVRLQNYGWAPVEQATYSFAFEAPGQTAAPGAMLSKQVGRFDTDVVFDLTDLVARSGGNVAALRRYAGSGFVCKTKEPAACLAEVRATGAFGSLGDRVRIRGNAVVVTTRGKLDYTYKDAKGGNRTASAPMRADVTLGGLRVEAECGAGGPPEMVRPKPIPLKLDQANYRVPLPFRRAIEAGRNNQYVLAVTADKSSNHEFQVVAKLSDGREIRSRPVNLLFFKPRQPAS